MYKVDTLGNIWAVLVAAADMSDKSGGKKLLEVALERLKTIRKIWTDNGFKGLKDWLSSKFNVDLEVVKREKDQQGFVVLPLFYSRGLPRPRMKLRLELSPLRILLCRFHVPRPQLLWLQ